MNTLIIYATKHGSTKRCAELLSSKLTGKVDLCNIKEDKVPELTAYDKVIIGGAVYAGSIAKELSGFCTKNLHILKEKKLGLYICCMNKKETDKQLNTAFPQELLNCAIVKKSLGGEFRLKEMNFFERLITKMVSKTLAKENPSLNIDTKKDLSMLSIESMDELVKLMNKQ